MDAKNCSLDGADQSHGSEVCGEGGCMICEDGQWSPKERSSEPDPHDPENIDPAKDIPQQV